MSRREYMKAPILTNTTLTVLRQCGKYVQMSRLLRPIAYEVIVSMSQLFNYYLFAVHTFFTADLVRRYRQCFMNYCSHFSLLWALFHTHWLNISTICGILITTSNYACGQETNVVSWILNICNSQKPTFGPCFEVVQSITWYIHCNIFVICGIILVSLSVYTKWTLSKGFVPTECYMHICMLAFHASCTACHPSSFCHHKQVYQLKITNYEASR